MAEAHFSWVIAEFVTHSPVTRSKEGAAQGGRDSGSQPRRPRSSLGGRWRGEEMRVSGAISRPSYLLFSFSMELTNLSSLLTAVEIRELLRPSLNQG